jgi:hypothetical protein
MNPWIVLQQLYDSEINAGMESDWDGGITAWVAGGRARLTQHTFERREFGQIANWLDFEARRLFPESKYARERSASSYRIGG